MSQQPELWLQCIFTFLNILTTTDITLTLLLTQPYLLSRPLRFWIIGNDGILHSENLEREGISHGHGNSIIHEQAYN